MPMTSCRLNSSALTMYTSYHSLYYVFIMMKRVLRAWLDAGKPCRRETSTMPQWAGSCW